MSSQSKPSKDGSLQTVRKDVSGEPPVRYISRPVRAAQTPDPLSDFLRLVGFIATILVISLLLVAVIGLIGVRLGFEPSIGLPTRSMGWSDFLINGFEMTRTLPDVITLVGNQQILLPVLGFMLIGTPAALLVIARPRVPGGPALSAQVQGLALAGSLFSTLFYVGSAIWLAGPWRTEGLDSSRIVTDGYASWFESFILICGVDAFLLCAMVPWLVFAFRLPLFRELQFATRAIALVGSIFILFGASITIGLHNGLMKPRLIDDSNSVFAGTVGDDLLVVELDQVTWRASYVFIEADSFRFQGMSSFDRLLRSDSR